MREDSQNGKRRLYKNPERGKICGVCAGIAEYFGFELWVVRIIAVSLLILNAFNGAIIIAYIVLCFVLDPKPGSSKKRNCFSAQNSNSFTSSHTENDDRPYRTSVKDVWKSGTSPKETLESIEEKFAVIERKLQGMESYVTSNAYDLEKKFKDI